MRGKSDTCLEGEEININIFWNVPVDVCGEEGLSEIVGEREDREMIGIHTETAGHTSDRVKGEKWCTCLHGSLRVKRQWNGLRREERYCPTHLEELRSSSRTWSHYGVEKEEREIHILKAKEDESSEEANQTCRDDMRDKDQCGDNLIVIDEAVDEGNGPNQNVHQDIAKTLEEDDREGKMNTV